MRNTFFTSDTHFGHANILLPDYENRPFDGPYEMDEILITNWNERVKDNDVVYHLGDFAFANKKRIQELLTRLNGNKFFIYGNHDKQLRKLQNDFDWNKRGVQADVLHSWALDEQHKSKVVGFDNYKELKFDEQLVVLFHYPLLTWNKKAHGSWHLHGHSHGHIPDDGNTRRLDVGVDSVGKYIGPHFEYSPISIEEVAMIMAGRTGGPSVDHHTGDR